MPKHPRMTARINLFIDAQTQADLAYLEEQYPSLTKSDIIRRLITIAARKRRQGE